jgi:hypothetical protein
MAVPTQYENGSWAELKFIPPPAGVLVLRKNVNNKSPRSSVPKKLVSMLHARKDEIFLPSAPAQGGIFYLNLIAVALRPRFLPPSTIYGSEFFTYAARVVCAF